MATILPTRSSSGVGGTSALNVDRDSGARAVTAGRLGSTAAGLGGTARGGAWRNFNRDPGSDARGTKNEPTGRSPPARRRGRSFHFANVVNVCYLQQFIIIICWHDDDRSIGTVCCIDRPSLDFDPTVQTLRIVRALQ